MFFFLLCEQSRDLECPAGDSSERLRMVPSSKNAVGRTPGRHLRCRSDALQFSCLISLLAFVVCLLVPDINFVIVVLHVGLSVAGSGGEKRSRFAQDFKEC
jgi:hypothetical protein